MYKLGQMWTAASSTPTSSCATPSTTSWSSAKDHRPGHQLASISFTQPLALARNLGVRAGRPVEDRRERLGVRLNRKSVSRRQRRFIRAFALRHHRRRPRAESVPSPSASRRRQGRHSNGPRLWLYTSRWWSPRIKSPTPALLVMYFVGVGRGAIA